MSENGSAFFYIVLGLIFFGPFILLCISWYFRRGASVLQGWASANDYEIVHSEFRNLRTGPFFGTGSSKQPVYYVTVRMKDGRERSCWVRCGSSFGGLFSDKTEVRWEDEISQVS
jgi:hypothetical protein